MLAVVVAVALILGYAKSIQATADAKANEQLLELHSALRLEMRIADVLAVWDSAKYPLLRLDDSPKKPYEDDEVWWIFSTPPRWHARNWCLFVGFRNEKVSKILVRTLDSEDIKPENSPPDEITLEIKGHP